MSGSPIILCSLSPSQGYSYSGFLWDSSSGIDLKDAAVLESPAVNGNGKHVYPRQYLAHFLVSVMRCPRRQLGHEVCVCLWQSCVSDSVCICVCKSCVCVCVLVN